MFTIGCHLSSAKGYLHMAKDAVPEVLASAPVIDDLAGAYVHEHGVDGEVAPTAGVHC